MDGDLVGFPDVSNSDVGNGLGGQTSEAKRKQKFKKKNGGFESMGLSLSVFKGIKKRGYKIPTPIQRKTIPVILSGSDVVAMARTGSGKTACFLIPMFEKLLASVKTPGARALILSPTRELALQTQKFISEIGKFARLKSIVILGGDTMESQFEALHGNPDIIVATPGRLMHVCVEMELKLSFVRYVVFDEADRLFEMGFGEQLKDIISRLPEVRQTLLFSATLPKALVEFARAGLSEPTLIRLDVESKIPDKLQLDFIYCRSGDKVATLLYLLTEVISRKSQTVIFTATKHHVEYLRMILDKAGILNSYIYSTLHPTARKINAAKFKLNKVPVLLVTDVAARGLDIPYLDFVINFHFPATSKLFVHRVGRCARAGRSGTAYSLVSHEELPYLVDLFLFLGRKLELEEDSSLGSVPPQCVEEHHSNIKTWSDFDLAAAKKTCENGYKAYLRSRPGASAESLKRVKSMGVDLDIKPHSLFSVSSSETVVETEKDEITNKIKCHRPRGTIFEYGCNSTTYSCQVMKAAKAVHKESISKYKRVREEEGQDNALITEFQSHLPNRIHVRNFKQAEDTGNFAKKKKKSSFVDTENFIPYMPSDYRTEQGLSLKDFSSESRKVAFDLTADNAEEINLKKNQKRWDRRKMKYVGVDEGPKIRTESGHLIPASYKSDKYAQWKAKHKVDENEESDGSDDEVPEARKAFLKKKFPKTNWGRHNEKLQEKIKSELKRPEQILKARIQKERIQERLKRNREKNMKKRRLRKARR